MDASETSIYFLSNVTALNFPTVESYPNHPLSPSALASFFFFLTAACLRARSVGDNEG